MATWVWIIYSHSQAAMVSQAESTVICRRLCKGWAFHGRQKDHGCDQHRPQRRVKHIFLREPTANCLCAQKPRLALQ